MTLNLNFIDKTHNEYECKPVLKKSRQKGLRECLSRCSAGLTFTALLESDYLSKRRTGSPPPPFGKQMYPSWGAISALIGAKEGGTKEKEEGRKEVCDGRKSKIFLQRRMSAN